MSMCVVVAVGDREFWKCQPATRENEVHYMATVVPIYKLIQSTQTKGHNCIQAPIVVKGYNSLLVGYY